MPGANLTRDEARERAGLVDVSAYKVSLDLTEGERTFGSTTTVSFTSGRPGARTWLDLMAPRVHSVRLNGRNLDPADVFDGARLHLDELAADNELVVVAECAYSRTGEGLHRFVDPVDGEVYLYSQFEVNDARRVFACFDQPDLKATFALTVDAPAGWVVVSNARSGEPQQVDAEVSRWVFPATPRLSTYVTAVVAGPYHAVRGEHCGRSARVPLGVFCRRSLAEHLDARELLEVTRAGFAFFEELFDYPYPFTKYDQLFVPEFNAGAMENAGCVTILEDYLFRSKVTDAAYERRAETVLHELAHMWFGDLVTMRWWDDLWLNESFATYVSVLCLAERTRWRNGWTTFANLEKTWAYRQDQLPSTHPIAADIPDIEAVEVNFDGITYAKGASVLKQLVAWVGREAFVEGLRRYFRRHEWGNTSLDDLLGALEETSGRDLGAWSTQWLQTAGVNVLRPELATDPEGRFTSFAVRQEAPAEHPTLRPHRIAIGLYDRSSEGLVRRERMELDIVGGRTEVPALVGRPRPDLVLVNDDDLTYAKLRLDDQSLTTLTSSIGEFTMSLPRTLCWAAAWDMTRDAEMAARDYLALVLEGIGAETDIAVVQLLLRQARLAADNYVEPAYRDHAQADLAEGLSRLLRDTEPGSDHQLAFVRAFASEARSDAHLGQISDLLSGHTSLQGLTVDTDLRWHLLHRLVACGRAGEGEIEAELRRDNTAAGQRHAAAARSACPDAAAKAAAWASVVEGGDELPNAVQTAIVSGFVQPDQRALLRPYVDRYFAAIPKVWASRSNEMAQNVVVGLYPAIFVEEETLAASDRFVAELDPPPALRRLVLEGRAGVERALRAQERDAGSAA
ncbi:MAG: aminopeptidase N [Acidothermales bacterium]|nr:aminopeptidase N [Acidothermales bacterium]